jgi:hypothetical protein
MTIKELKGCFDHNRIITRRDKVLRVIQIKFESYDPVEDEVRVSYITEPEKFYWVRLDDLLVL